MRNVPCLCGGRDEVDELFPQNFGPEELSGSNFSARGKHTFEGRHFHYRIVRCRGCGQVFSTPILEAEEIERLYRASVQTYTGEAAGIVSAYLGPLRRWLRELPARDRALELGCGSGFCLEALRDLGFRSVLGTEPSADAVAKAKAGIRSSIVNAPFERAPLAGQRFDLVCAFQVLDHLQAPLDAVRTVHELLRPGGIFYAIIHDVGALHVKLLGERSPIVDVSHIYYFDRKTLPRLLERGGFEVLDLFRVWNTYTLSTWLDMAPLPFKGALARFLARFGLSGLRATIPAGNIGVVGRRPRG